MKAGYFVFCVLITAYLAMTCFIYLRPLPAPNLKASQK